MKANGMIKTLDFQCQCGRPLAVPVRPEWDDPMYVFHMVDEVEFVKKQLQHAHKEMLELAQECLDAGVRPEVMRRADETLKLFNELKKRLGLQ